MGRGGLYAEGLFKDGEHSRIVAAPLRRGAGQGAEGDDCAAALPELLHLGQGRGPHRGEGRQQQHPELQPGDLQPAILHPRAGERFVVDEVEVDARLVHGAGQGVGGVGGVGGRGAELGAGEPVGLDGGDRVEDGDVGHVAPLAEQVAQPPDVVAEGAPALPVGLAEVHRRRHPLVPAAEGAVEHAVAVVEVEPVGVVLVGPGEVVLRRVPPAGAPVGGQAGALLPVQVGDGAGQLGLEGAGAVGVLLVARKVVVPHVAEEVAVVVGLAEHVQPLAVGAELGVAHAACVQPVRERPEQVLLQQGHHEVVVLAADLVGARPQIHEQGRQQRPRIEPLLSSESLQESL